jgi:lambda family phage portal protein
LVLHLYRVLREGQTRGLPALAPVLEVLKQLDKYIDAEVDRAANSALFMAFLTTKDDFDATFGEERDEYHSAFERKLNSGKYAIDHSSVARLYPGDHMEFADPKSPNPNAETFIKTFATLIGTALEIPQEVLLRHFSSSYSAARGALLMAWQHFEQRRTWLARNLCQPVYEAVITDAVAAGRLRLPGFLDDPFARQAWLGAEWIGSPMHQIDENKAVTAARERIEMGVSTLRRETAHLTGQDYDNVRRQRAKEARVDPRQMALDIPSADDLDREDNR